MTEIVSIGIEMKSLSLPALKVIRAGVAHAAEHRDEKLHNIPLDEFCEMAGTGLLTAEAIALLFREGQKVIAYEELFDTEVPVPQCPSGGSSSVFGEFSASSTNVTFQVSDYILRDDIMRIVMALKPRIGSRKPG